MKITIHFKTDNAAFTDYPGETDRIILETARRITNLLTDRETYPREWTNTISGSIADTNGNTIGNFQVTGR